MKNYSRKLERLKRTYIMLSMRLFRGGHKRAEYLRNSKMFGDFGKCCYWFPRKLPAEPSAIKIHNNVNIATDVYFCDHDVIQHMLNNVPDYVKILPEGKSFNYKVYKIEIFDNVFVGAHSIIMGNVKIGPNAIVAAGSVVTKDVPPNSVVGGNPARVLKSMEEYLRAKSFHT